MNTWKVYKHTPPTGKVYIGITSAPLHKRWKNGKAYGGCAKFNATIQKYSWDNIQHELLFENLSESEAKSIECKLIREYKSLGISLNITDGGDGHRMSLSKESRAKISDSLKKYYSTHPGTYTGRHVSEETKAKIRAKVTKYRHTEEAKAKIREASIRSNACRKGKPSNPQSVAKMRVSIIEYYQTHINATTGTIWINNGIIRKRVPNNILEQYISAGWNVGYKLINK